MRRAVIVMLVVAIALDAAYWSIWFTRRDWIASEHTQAYYDFENAFPLADLWLGVAILMALIALRAGRPSALFWLIWKEHHRFFSRYGFADTKTSFLNAVLLFVVLLYVYPLKFLFTMLHDGV